MSMTHKLNFALDDGTRLNFPEVSIPVGAQVRIDESIPIGNNQLVALTLDVSQMAYLIILADQALTLEFNNSTSGVPTIVLEANEFKLWFDSGSGGPANPLGTDVTALYVTNASDAAARLRLWAGYDPTV